MGFEAAVLVKNGPSRGSGNLPLNALRRQSCPLSTLDAHPGQTVSTGLRPPSSAETWKPLTPAGLLPSLVRASPGLACKWRGGGVGSQEGHGRRGGLESHQLLGRASLKRLLVQCPRARREIALPHVGGIFHVQKGHLWIQTGISHSGSRGMQ